MVLTIVISKFLAQNYLLESFDPKKKVEINLKTSHHIDFVDFMLKIYPILSGEKLPVLGMD